MRISACFPTLGNLKKLFKKKNDNFRTYWRLPAKVFQWSSFKLAIYWETIYSISPKKLNKILWKNLIVNKRKRFNTISDTKSNTVHLKYTTLLSLQQQNQDMSLLLLQGLDCLTLVSLDLLILYNELVMLSFPSFPFIVLFLQVFWSNFAILLKFLSKKSNHFLAKPSTSFLSPASLSSCPLQFHVSPNLSIAFFSYFLSFLFIVFEIRLSFLRICFSSTFTFFKSLC